MLKILLVGFIVAVTLALAGLLSFTDFGDEAVRDANHNVSTAETAADRFIDRLRNGQLEPAHQSASAELQARQSLNEFAQFTHAHSELWGSLVRRKSGIVLSSGGRISKAFVEYVRLNDLGSPTCTLVLKRIEGEWAVDEVIVRSP